MKRINTLVTGIIAMVSTLLMARPVAAKSLGWNADALSVELAGVHQLPPLTAGTRELSFSDLYVKPVGPGGLAFTAKAKALDGQRVRVLGFMVKQTRPSPGVLILSPYAMSTHEGEYGLCDDLPPSVIFVEVPKFKDIAVPFTSGPLMLTGRFEIGRREETDGRVSFARLILDPEEAAGSVTLHADSTTAQKPKA
jgi:hypothetical protein